MAVFSTIQTEHPLCGGKIIRKISHANFIKEHYDSQLRTNKKIRDHFQDKMFTGYDTDQTMLRITAMNTILHGMDNADIRFNDSLSKNHTDADQYTLVLANPPFKGSLDNDTVAANLTSKVDTKKTELLFVALFLRILDAEKKPQPHRPEFHGSRGGNPTKRL